MRYRFTAEAELDIEEIGDYIARDNPRRAASFVRELRVRCRALAKFPKTHPVRGEFGEDVRVAVHGNYLIFYAVRGGLVEILRVIHGARNISVL
jgi:toxin ParE1/3/4